MKVSRSNGSKETVRLDHPRVDNSRDEEMKRLYAEGWSLEAIAAVTTFSRASVTRRLRAHGVKIRGRGGGKQRLSNKEIEMTRFMYEELDMTVADIAEQLGVVKETIRGRLDRYGIPRRTRGEAATLRLRRRYAP